MTLKSLRKYYLIGLAYACLFALTYRALENEQLYMKVFSSFMPTYETWNGATYRVTKPFTKVTNESLILMDAVHYSYIRDHFYVVNPEDPESPFRFAFFPLFPVVWKFFSNIGIVVLNFFLFFSGILLLAAVFCPRNIKTALMVALALPTLTVFFLPYSESLFFFLIALALYGQHQSNKHLYFSALFLAALTRPVFLLFIAALIGSEIFLFIRTRKFKIDWFLPSIVAVLSGTAFVACLQLRFNGGHLFSFISSQKNWGTYFRIPHSISDWSVEGYGMNAWALIFCVIFGLSILLFDLFKKESRSDFSSWYHFSWIYLVMVCVYVLLFQGGVLHSLYRYTICSPFFFIVLFHHIRFSEQLVVRQSLLLITLFGLTAFIFLSLVHLENQPELLDFSRLGFALLVLNLLVFLFVAKQQIRYQFPVYAIMILLSLVWNTYLYNMYISKGWIFL